MFGLFKKTSWKIEGKSLAFFHSLFSQLPAQYGFLLEGLAMELYSRYTVNYSMSTNHYYIGFDPSQSDRTMIKGLQFEIKNIQITEGGNSYDFSLLVYDGLWSGFEFEKDITKLKDYRIDVSQLKEEIILNEKLAKIIGDVKSEQLDLHDLSEVDVNGKIYYQIKDLEDGNYICIDSEGRVFGLIHDPFEIELINKSLIQFVEEVNSGRFNFDKYLELKTTKPNPS